MNDATVKKARRTAIIIGTSLSLMLISFVYAFVKQTEAKRHTEIAQEVEKECTRKLIELSMELEIKTKEAEAQYARAQNALSHAEEMRVKTEAALNRK